MVSNLTPPVYRYILSYISSRRSQMAIKDNKSPQQLYKDDRQRLQLVIEMLTRRKGKQATMADAVRYLLDGYEKARK